jgi:hypothetical protein
MVQAVQKEGIYPEAAGQVYEKPNFTCPRNSVEVYQLANFVEELLLNGYCNLVEHTSRNEDLGLLKKLIALQQQEILQMEMDMNFELNCEIGHFYNSGGTGEMTSIASGVLANKVEQIYSAFDGFRREVDDALWQALQTIRSGDRNDATASELFIECLYARDRVVAFFNYLAEVYPDGAESQLLKELAQLMRMGSAKLVKKSMYAV